MTTEKIQSEYNIPLGNGKYATIALCNLDKIEGYTWRLTRNRGQAEYARGSKVENGKHLQPFLHRLIVGAPPAGLEIGHKDGNGLRCLRDNLHFVTHRQNAQGPRGIARRASSKYRGVCQHLPNRWRANIRVEEKNLHLGVFYNEIAAAEAYDVAARKHYGEHAGCNFPLGDSK